MLFVMTVAFLWATLKRYQYLGLYRVECLPNELENIWKEVIMA